MATIAAHLVAKISVSMADGNTKESAAFSGGSATMAQRTSPTESCDARRENDTSAVRVVGNTSESAQVAAKIVVRVSGLTNMVNIAAH
tara:strand:+ start:2383 stop:2646 length:264 start_codon:yes stop_codon:yes gene_type:complete